RLDAPALGHGLGRASACSANRAIRLLVARGADPNRSEHGSTCLRTAIEWSDRETVALLLELGADPWIGDKTGMNAVAFARDLWGPKYDADDAVMIAALERAARSQGAPR